MDCYTSVLGKLKTNKIHENEKKEGTIYEKSND
jgi:hypothetical protein